MTYDVIARMGEEHPRVHKVDKECPHVALSEPLLDPRGKPAVPGRSVRFGGILHNFEPLIDSYGSAFVVRLLDAFTLKYVLSNPGVTQKRSSQLRRCLMHIAGCALRPENIGTPVVRAYRAMVEGTDIAKSDMIDAVETFCAPLRDLTDRSIIASSNALSRKPIIENLSTTLQDLAGYGLWPNIGPLTGMGRGKLSGNNIPALGELVRPDSEDSENSSTYAKVQELNRTRLLHLRALLVEKLLSEEAAFDQGQRLLQRTGLPSLSKVRKAVELLTDYGHSQRRSGLPEPVAACFPLQDEDTRKANLLRYLQAEYGGVFRLLDLPYGLQRVIATCGGIEAVKANLEGNSRALVAAFNIVLIDTGLNVQPCDDLAADPFIGSAERGLWRLRTIGGVKNRQNFASVSGRIVEQIESNTTLPAANAVPNVVKGSSVSGVRAIEIWQKLSAPFRARTGLPERERLWILPRNTGSGEGVRCTASTWKGWWQEYLEEIENDEILGRLPIQRRMIRTTVEQLREATHGGNSTLVAAMSDRAGSRTLARHYWNRAYLRRHRHDLIREFQNQFEARVLDENMARKLGIPDDVYAKRLNDAVENGLGFLCEDPYAGVQPDVPTGIQCSSLEACPSCPLLTFHPSEAAVRDLILFKVALEAAEEEFFARNPERWMKVWLVAQALVLAVVGLLENSSKKRLVTVAEHAVAQGVANGTLALFKPW